MSDHEKSDRETWRKNLLSKSSIDEASLKEEKVDENEKWREACEKVFKSSNEFAIQKLTTTDEAQVDQGARSYRRASLQDTPIRALDHSKLSASVVIDLEHLPGIQNLAFEDESGTSGILRKSQSVGLSSRRNLTISGDLSTYSVHNAEGFPRVHQVLLRKKQHRDASSAQHTQPAHPAFSAINALAVPIPTRSRKISTGKGMPTIRDEDSENPDFEENFEVVIPASSRTDPSFYITSMGETESESEMERLPWQIRNRRQSQLSQFSITDNYGTDEDILHEGQNVKFNQPESETEMDEKVSDQKHSKRKKHQRKSKHSYHRKKHSHLTDDNLHSRKAVGSDLLSESENPNDNEDRDYMEITSHRFDPLARQVLHKMHRVASDRPRRYSNISWTEDMAMEMLQQQVQVPVPHEVFVEMDELRGDEWQEQARWIKFEEHLLDGADRWGRAHIASLSFHSVINLRLVLEECILLLDIETSDYHSTVYRLVEEMSIVNDLSGETKSKIFRSLLLPRRFVDVKPPERRKLTTQISEKGIEIGEEKLTSSTSFNELYKLATVQRRDNILNKLAPGTEGTMTLVGALETIKKPLVGLIRLAKGTVMPNMMEVQIPVRFIFVLFTPIGSVSMDCHEIGRAFSTLMSNKKFQKVCYLIEERQQLLNSINNFLDETVVLPPGDWDKKNLLSMADIMELKRKKRIRLAAIEKMKKEKDEQKASDKPEKLVEQMKKEELKKPEKLSFDPMVRTRVPFGGIINEMKERLPKMKSDVTDSFNVMCLAAIIFIFFAALSGAIAFGGLLERKTGGLIGISETLITSAILACIYHLFAGQPLILIGVTGPVMVFDEALYRFTKNAEVDFLAVRVWVAIWAAIIAIAVAAFEGSVVVRYYTKFTKDIFVTFVASVFIIEALLQTAGFFREHPTVPLLDYCLRPDVSSFLGSLTITEFFDENNKTTKSVAEFEYPIFDDEPNTAFKSFILQFCTFGIAYYFRILKTGKAFGRKVRKFVGDFGLPLSIVIMVAVDKGFPSVHTETINIPDGLELTSPNKRSWLINPLGADSAIPLWIPFVAVIPALLLYILLFVNGTLCQLIAMEKCKKGCGLHWDMVLLCLLNVPTSLFGGPWMCVALVRSVTHLSVLTVWSTNHAPGESPKFVEVKDQRVTGFMIHLLFGLAILAAPVLREIPMAVVFGVFLYLGICSLIGLDFVDRIYLIFYPPKHHPSLPYVQQVRTWKMHLYTLCQATGLAILWIVKSTPAALFFPFFVMFLVPFRFSLKFIFTPKELEALDGSGIKSNEDDTGEDDDETPAREEMGG